MRYLIVDDDAVYRSRLRTALEKRGQSVMAAPSTDEAINLLKTELPERVLVDLRMGGASGLDLLAWLGDHAPAVPTVVLTGFGSIATTQEAIRRGAVGYLTKPCSIERILAAFEPPLSLKPEEIPLPSLEQVEWDHIQRILADCNGNVTRAAKVLGMDRRSLQRRLAKPPTLR